MKQLVFFLLLSLQLSAQDFVAKKGVVIDDLKVSDTLGESYALYLPSNFQNERSWPVIFIFDEQGRGKASALLFRSAAEEQGYILVASKDIDQQNDLEKNALVASRLIQYIGRMLPVDFQQIATAGSMTGAKTATSIPPIFDNILGVIAVGDHWMNFNLLEKKNNFVFIGIVGDEQFSVAGMNHTANALSRLRYPSQVYSYEGDKEWPDTEIINSAVGSLTLDAMRRKLRPQDQEIIGNLYRQDLSRVNKLMSQNRLLNAENLLKIMDEKYSGLISTTEVRSQQDQLMRSRNYSQQKREQSRVLEKENRLIDDFTYYLEEDIRTANFENLGWWNYQKNQLDSLAQKNDAEAKMAQRLKGFINEFVRLKHNELRESRRSSLESKLLANMIQTIFDPRAFDAYKSIISLSAQDNDFQTAYFYLEEMLKHGYKDMEALYEIEGTLGLRLTPEYNTLIEKYLGESKFHDSTRP
ncbi:hypothetical protein [Salinimicrobium xinjiangense]|uniref:hypothetical protein n=1 Tax=Salinimicrobium xinjiangense TaxID=438596 RepID=UPI00042238D7|nr:hypothetical protein [Salinimicrobium xinjiangense]